ncbi:cytochrome c oxidase assembly protein [Gordonia terrae]|nr:cytochrome c oxidase assembly protein [Gordonia terrae]
MTALVFVGVIYIVAAQRCRRQPRGWNHWHTASFIVGLIVLGLALRPSTSDAFSDHMLGHLLLGMYAPLALALGAPMTLILRTAPVSVTKPLVHLLRPRPAQIATHPAVLLTSTIGGLAALYFTPLFARTERHEALHMVMHVHFFVSGYLFAWMIAGPDPGPERPSVRTRLAVLGLAILGHAVIAQLLYAGLFVRVDAPLDELRAGGTLMYYWGDIAEILLALALLLTWRPDHRGKATGQRRRRDREPVAIRPSGSEIGLSTSSRSDLLDGTGQYPAHRVSPDLGL